MNITIIGSGNVGTTLAGKLAAAGHNINTGPQADLYIVAIPDDKLPHLKNQLTLNDELIVHTTGSVSKDVLKDISPNYGVLYPLQTIRKEIQTAQIPFLIDANTEENKLLIQKIAREISREVAFADDEQRKKIHLAAVVTNNFTNHLLTLTKDFCKKEKVDFNLLQPLLQETIRRGFSDKDYQTGPAQRNDQTTLQKQREMLMQHPSLLKIYNLFTESIISARSS